MPTAAWGSLFPCVCRAPYSFLFILGGVSRLLHTHWDWQVVTMVLREGKGSSRTGGQSACRLCPGAGRSVRSFLFILSASCCQSHYQLWVAPDLSGLQLHCSWWSEVYLPCSVIHQQPQSRDVPDSFISDILPAVPRALFLVCVLHAHMHTCTCTQKPDPDVGCPPVLFSMLLPW